MHQISFVTRVALVRTPKTRLMMRFFISDLLPTFLWLLLGWCQLPRRFWKSCLHSQAPPTLRSGGPGPVIVPSPVLNSWVSPTSRINDKCQYHALQALCRPRELSFSSRAPLATVQSVVEARESWRTPWEDSGEYRPGKNLHGTSLPGLLFLLFHPWRNVHLWQHFRKKEISSSMSSLPWHLPTKTNAILQCPSSQCVPQLNILCLFVSRLPGFSFFVQSADSR